MTRQHDDHCLMNVDYKVWRVLEVSGHFMTVVSSSGNMRVADLNLIDWSQYCANAAAWLKEEGERIEREKEDKARLQQLYRECERQDEERERAKREREWREIMRQALALDRLLASSYGPIDDLEREVVLVDLEDTDANEILAVDCQTFHLERLTP